MEDNEPKYNRVVAYIRKSSEDNKEGEAKKQLNSLEYQNDFVKEAIKKYKLELAGPIFEDTKTGYEAFVRDDFAKMLDYLKDHKDEIDGIVCTEISRLARNFADGGMILWYLQNGTIKRIYTPTKVFTDSSGDQLMVAIEFAMSKKSSDDTGYRTIEGMKSKARVMKHPARPAILGYFTEGKIGQKKWIIDPKKGPLVRQVFEQFATGKYTFDQIADYAFNIGLKSINKKTIIGKISKNTWRNRLSDVQYTGIFESDGERIVGEYKHLIDTPLFYRVQEIITDHEHPKTTHLDYAYSGMFKCGLCGGMLSGTHKKGITYYRCGKRKTPCKDIARITYIPEKQLEDSLMTAFENIEIDQDTWKAAREYVAEINQPQKLDIKKQIRMIGEKISAEQNTQINVGRRFSANEYTKIDYDRLMEDSRRKEASYRNTIIKCENIVNELDELMYQFLDNIKYVTKKLRLALPENKREMVDIFCENLEWKDGKALWDWKKPYFIIANRPKNSTVLPL
ncbi:recombinase family protein [Patescibacteria group bacterium]|nr:recombinase family protein [Patescibacteria group bacterium]